MKKWIILLGFVAAFMVACEEKLPDADSISLSSELLEFDPEGGANSFQIVTSHSWEIVVPRDSKASLSATKGTGNATIAVILPRKTSGIDTEERLIVRSDDGGCIRNVVLRQKGLLISGAFLNVSNHGNYLPLGGLKYSLDSLLITSNIPWEVKGPEWIEAFNGKEWVKLSPERAMLKGGETIDEVSNVYTLYLRTVTANEEETNRIGTISVTQSYEGGLSVNIAAVQLGKYETLAYDPVLTANSMGWTWKYGVGVSKILCTISDGPLDESELTPDNILKWFLSDKDDLLGIDGLDETTEYYVYTSGVDNANQTHSPTYVSYITGSSVNQPLASIQNVTRDGEKWKWQVRRNEYCLIYRMWINNDENWMVLNDGQLAYVLSRDMHDPAHYQEKTVYSTDRDMEWEIDTHINIITWGFAQESSKMSSVFSRYRTYYDYEWPDNTASVPWRRASRLQSVPYNLEAISKSFIRIK